MPSPRWASTASQSVRQGKVFNIELTETDPARAEAALKEMGEKLLANTVIENYQIEVG